MNVEKILIKFSGDHFKNIKEIAKTILELQLSKSIAVMCGGGNIIRGGTIDGKRGSNDRIGMLSTLINGLQLCDYLDGAGCVFGSISTDMSKPYNIVEIKQAMEKGKIPILCCGLGCGFVSTDTGLVVRGLELECNFVVKVSKIPNIFSADPMIDPSAVPFSNLAYDEAIKLNAMDKSAICIAKSNKMPIIFTDLANVVKVVMGDRANCTFIN
jgi:uridylate kinase